MKISNILKIAVGFIALSLGAIGLVIPIWPTTPFVLLSLACFSSTPKIKEKILRIKFFKEYYDSYTKGTPLRHRTVSVSLIFLWGMLILSALVLQEPLVTIILAAVGIAVTIHILLIAKSRKLKTRQEDNHEQ